MHTPYGPHRIGQNRQIALPADLMKSVDLGTGDSVYLQVNPDAEGTLIVVPVEMAARWFEIGRRASLAASEAPTDEGAAP